MARCEETDGGELPDPGGQPSGRKQMDSQASLMPATHTTMVFTQDALKNKNKKALPLRF